MELKNVFERLKYFEDKEINEAVAQVNEIVKQTRFQILGKRKNRHYSRISDKNTRTEHQIL